MIGTRATPLEALRIYISVKQHMINKNFDIFERGYAIRVTEDHLNERNDRTFFYRLSEEYLIGDLRDFYMSNIMDNRSHPSEMQDVVYKEWKAKQHGICYRFETDLKTLVGLGYGLRNLFTTTNGKLPISLQAYNGGHICLDTICIINNLTNGTTLEVFDEQIKDLFTYTPMRLKIVKYMGFVNMNEKLRDIFLKYINK